MATLTAMQRSDIDSSSGLTANADTLFMAGGVALMVFGAGLVLANPSVRRLLGQLGVGNMVQAALPDLERYIRLRDM